MKSVLRSAKPYWIYLILTGKKTVEVGKDFPKSEDWNKVVEMYCSKDMQSFNRIPEKDREWMRKYLGKVACRFVCDRIEEFMITERGVQFRRFSALHETCLTLEDMRAYSNGASVVYGWHISDLKIYDKPKELGEFFTVCNKTGNDDCGDCLYLRVARSSYPCDDDIDTWCGVDNKKPLIRPFQSWGYVEELTE